MTRRFFIRLSREDHPDLYGTLISPLLEYGSQPAHSKFPRDFQWLEMEQRANTESLRDLAHLPNPTQLQAKNYLLDRRHIAQTLRQVR